MRDDNPKQCALPGCEIVFIPGSRPKRKYCCVEHTLLANRPAPKGKKIKQEPKPAPQTPVIPYTPVEHDEVRYSPDKTWRLLYLNGKVVGKQRNIQPPLRLTWDFAPDLEEEDLEEIDLSC